MGTAVALVNDGARGIAGIDLKNVNYGLAKASVQAYIKAAGGGARRKKNFPGEQITFKHTGNWVVGFGQNVKPLKTGTELIANLPNVMACWVRWQETDSGKRYPEYTDVRFPAAGDKPILRSELSDPLPEDYEEGDELPEGWEIEKGQLKDPWRTCLVIPVRKLGGEEVHHILLATMSYVIAGYNFFDEVIEEMKLHSGELPVMQIGVGSATKKNVTKSKSGKTKTEVNTWPVPTFKLTGWADALDVDNPAKGGMKVKDDDETADLGGVTVTSRKKKNGKVAAKALPKPTAVAGKNGKKRKIEPVEDDDDPL